VAVERAHLLDLAHDVVADSQFRRRVWRTECDDVTGQHRDELADVLLASEGSWMMGCRASGSVATASASGVVTEQDEGEVT
jgi:hypothetical protein